MPLGQFVNINDTLKAAMLPTIESAVDGLAAQNYMTSLNNGVPITMKVKPQTASDGLAKAATPTTGLDSANDIGKYKELWSQMYQTTNDPQKEAQYMQHVTDLYGKAPEEANIRAAINQVLPAFDGEIQNRGFSGNDMHELLYRTALHESMGGKYNKQIEGPARSWWQVEPATAYDNIQNFGHALGPSYEKATGYSADKLKDMNETQIANLLEKDPNFAASMAALWYLRKMPKV